MEMYLLPFFTARAAVDATRNKHALDVPLRFLACHLPMCSPSRLASDRFLDHLQFAETDALPFLGERANPHGTDASNSCGKHRSYCSVAPTNNHLSVANIRQGGSIGHGASHCHPRHDCAVLYRG